MPSQRIRHNLSAILLLSKSNIYTALIILSGFLGIACTTRVSEWVLLNIVPVNYSIKYVHSGTVAENLKNEQERLKQDFSGANVRFTDFAKEGITQPYYGLYFKNRFFAKYSSPNELKALTTSPLREKIAVELMDGKLCVLLYLRSGNEMKDEKVLEVLTKTIATSPFRDIIPVFELNRNSKEEDHFITMLLNVEDDLKAIREPMLFGIFGRFKALEPLVSGGITEENIRLMIDYLKAECSCLIKDDLPGTDILFAGNWKNPQPARLNKILDENPELAK